MAKKLTNVQKIDVGDIDLKPLVGVMVTNPLPTQIKNTLQLKFLGLRATWVKTVSFPKKKV